MFEKEKLIELLYIFQDVVKYSNDNMDNMDNLNSKRYLKNNLNYFFEREFNYIHSNITVSINRHYNGGRAYYCSDIFYKVYSAIKNYSRELIRFVHHREVDMEKLENDIRKFEYFKIYYRRNKDMFDKCNDYDDFKSKFDYSHSITTENMLKLQTISHILGFDNPMFDNSDIKVKSENIDEFLNDTFKTKAMSDLNMNDIPSEIIEKIKIKGIEELLNKL